MRRALFIVNLLFILPDFSQLGFPDCPNCDVEPYEDDDTKKHVLFVFGRKDRRMFKEVVKARSIFVLLMCDKCCSPALQCVTY